MSFSYQLAANLMVPAGKVFQSLTRAYRTEEKLSLGTGAGSASDTGPRALERSFLQESPHT